MISTQFLREIHLVETDMDESCYPLNIPAIASLRNAPLQFHPKVTFIIGENGSGKSTLIEAIAVASGLNAEGGSRNFNFSTRATHSGLNQAIKLIRGYKRPKEDFFLRAESFYNVSTQVEDLGVTGYGTKALHNQSHGESFLALMLNRFRPNGLYILDEPEAALSPSRQMSMLRMMHESLKANCQFIIATHSPIIMAYPDACIYRLSESGIELTTFEDTEHVIITRRFLNNTKQMLNLLLADTLDVTPEDLIL